MLSRIRVFAAAALNVPLATTFLFHRTRPVGTSVNLQGAEAAACTAPVRIVIAIAAAAMLLAAYAGSASGPEVASYHRLTNDEEIKLEILPFDRTRLVLTTGTANHLIADVWAVRNDFYHDHPAEVAGLLGRPCLRLITTGQTFPAARPALVRLWR